MDNEEQEKTASNKKPPFVENPATTEYVDETDSNPPTPQKQAEASGQEKTDVKDTVNADNSRKEEPAIKANSIAIWAIVVNVIVGAFTILLFYQTKRANNISRDAVAFADSAFRQTKRANDLSEASFNEAQKRGKSDDERDVETYRLNKMQLEASRMNDSLSNTLNQKTLEQQIAILDAAKRQLGFENQSFIEYRDFRLDTFQVDKPVRIQYNVVNIGKMPIKITYSKMGVFWKTAVGINPSGYLKTLQEEILSGEFYVTGQTPRSGFFSGFDKMTKESFEAIKAERMFLFFCGEIFYTNEMTKKRMKHVFSAWLLAPKLTEFKIMYLENAEVR